MKELSEMEMKELAGGFIAYNPYVWYDGDNGLIYAGAAVVNAGIAVSNAGLWLWNKITG